MPHLILVGFDEIISGKYMSCVSAAIESNSIDGYSIVDLLGEEASIESRLVGLPSRPENIYYLPTSDIPTSPTDIRDFDAIVQKLKTEHLELKVYIATEVRSHEMYLAYCIENAIDSLVEKPVVAPMSPGGFAPERIKKTMSSLVAKTKTTHARHSVMVLNRYSEIFSDQLVNKLKPLMIEFQAPISSLHLRFSGGVWALHDEYDSREDHPYKYGYGVLMHGAYHFIDIVTQLLSLNRLVFPDDIFIMSLTSFGAFPSDHVDRVSQKVRTDFDDQGKNLARTSPSTGIVYGETDIVTSFSVTNKSTGSVITLGTLAFEQTTPSVRHWKALPSIYNVNGRLTSVNVEARLGHLQSITVDYYDKPGSDAVLDPDNIESFAQITIKSNASLLEKHAYVQTKEFHHVHSSDSNRALLNAWLNGTETLSDITTHVLPMLLTQYLAQSAKKPGTTITFDLEC